MGCSASWRIVVAPSIQNMNGILACDISLCKKARLCAAIAGGSPAASHFLLLRQKKVTQEKATPVCRRYAVPCVARQVRRLRNSRYALRQSSPTSPDLPALLGGAQGMEKQSGRRLAGECPPTFEMPTALLVVVRGYATNQWLVSATHQPLTVVDFHFPCAPPTTHCAAVCCGGD